MRSTGTAYLLWLTVIFGLAGIHRFYTVKYMTGILYLFTFGLFGVGQFLDLFLIPGMVEEKNLKYKMLYSNPNHNPSHTQQVIINVADHITPNSNTNKPSAKSDIQIILELAKNSSGHISVADCLIATGKPVVEIKQTIQSLCAEGLLEAANHPDTGAVIYKLI